MEDHLDQKKYAACARQAAAEGIVLLKNDREALPLNRGDRIAVFGINQFHYYKSGNGSGGMVNTAYEVSILDALKAKENAEGGLALDREVMGVYEEWITKHPLEKRSQWGTEAWNQKEMPLEETVVVQASKRNDAALIMIGRTAGEDQDNSATEGSFLLTQEEEKMIALVSRHSKRSVVLFNTGNICDMRFVKKYDPAAVCYVWQGGQEGGNAVVDVLTGIVNPSGKLTDTIAESIYDYPSTAHFGDGAKNAYCEDIYVGYRYFETFAKEKVLYPFGFGLSYTTFEIKVDSFCYENNRVTVQVQVRNTGSSSGKEVVQLYCQAPQGCLGKPFRSLCGFVKTKKLMPGEEQMLTISCETYWIASYDDGSCQNDDLLQSRNTKQKNTKLENTEFCYVLEQGCYRFYLGSDVRSAAFAGSFELKSDVVLQRLKQALAPVEELECLHPEITDDIVKAGFVKAQNRRYSLQERMQNNLPETLSYIGNKGYQLLDVAEGRVSMEAFIAQLSADELMCLVRAEGMNSPKATPGIAGAFGGVTPALHAFGIPVAGCADGPSGIRMDCGTQAFSLPNGTCLACSFNETLMEELFSMLGQELLENGIDTLLGSGMNLHRNPLNGRNFEYFSEDPYLTGKIAAAQLKGLHKSGTTGTIKHFACNNQEFHRTDIDAVVSERALRELYLKGFEIAVKEGGAYCIMSMYGAINGLWAASNYDLLTTILRDEWGYDGLVMSDWWAKGNEEGKESSKQEMAAMIRSQNDLYMVTDDSLTNTNHDNLPEALSEDAPVKSKLTIGELQRSAMNICKVLIRMPVMEKLAKNKKLAKNEQK